MTTTPPTICAGNDTQPACKHYQGDSCHHPKNVKPSLVSGRDLPDFTAQFLRSNAEKCGPGATWYEPKPKPAPAADGLPF